MTFTEETIYCTLIKDYQRSNRTTPFTLAYTVLNYNSNPVHKSFIDDIFIQGQALANVVNPAAANNAGMNRGRGRILENATAGVLAEHCWKEYINWKAGNIIVTSTEFVAAATQIDLVDVRNERKIEVRSSFPRNGIQFAICSQNHEFDILGPYANSVKPSEIQKEFYARTLFHRPARTAFIDLVKQDGFKVHLTGGATWAMMTSRRFAINKPLIAEDELSEVESESVYRVVPFSRALDTVQLYQQIVGVN